MGEDICWVFVNGGGAGGAENVCVDLLDSDRGLCFLHHGRKIMQELIRREAVFTNFWLPRTQTLRRDLPSSDYGMASKTARQKEEGFIGVIGNSQVDGGSS